MINSTVPHLFYRCGKSVELILFSYNDMWPNLKNDITGQLFLISQVWSLDKGAP